MVDMGPDPATGVDLSHSVRQPTISGFTEDQINALLFPKDPDGNGETLLVVGITAKGQWATFKPLPGVENYGIPVDIDKWKSKRLQTIRGAVDLQMKPGPNGAFLVTGWKRKWS